MPYDQYPYPCPVMPYYPPYQTGAPLYPQPGYSRGISRIMPYDPWDPSPFDPTPTNPREWLTRGLASDAVRTTPMTEQDEAFLRSCTRVVKDIVDGLTEDKPTTDDEREAFLDLLACCCELDGFLRANGYQSNPVAATRGSAKGTRGACGDMIRAGERGDWGGVGDHGPGCIREIRDALR